MYDVAELLAEMPSFAKDALGWIHDNASYYVPSAAFVVSICSLLFTAVSLRGTKRSGDLTSLIKFVETLQAAEKAFLAEQDESEKDDRFVELLNILEAYCAAYNAKLLPKKTRQLVRDKLVDSIALIRHYQVWNTKFEEAQLGRTAFEELKRFEQRRRWRIRQAAKTFAPIIPVPPTT